MGKEKRPDVLVGYGYAGGLCHAGIGGMTLSHTHTHSHSLFLLFSLSLLSFSSDLSPVSFSVIKMRDGGE